MIDASKIPAVYERPATVTGFEVGKDRLLRPSALLRIQQEVGNEHLSLGGLDYNGVASFSMAFVIIRNRIDIKRLPEAEETVCVRTWHYDTQGVRVRRCYSWVDAAGAPLIDCLTEYAVVDLASHRLLRSDRFTALGVPAHPVHCDCPDPGREPSVPLAPAGFYAVRPSQTDINGHFNNAAYADMLCDVAAPQDRALRGMTLWYHKEVRAGEELQLAVGTAENEVFLKAFSGGILRFSGALYT